MSKNNTANEILSISVVALMIVLGVGSCGKHDSSSSSSSSHIETNHRYRITGGAVGFSSKSNLEKYLQFYEQNDSSRARVI